MAEGKTDSEKVKHEKIVDGFKINWMVMRDAETGKIKWESDNWKEAFSDEMKITIPADILKCKTVSREMNFSSKEMIRNFRLVQNVQLNGQNLEEWQFDFGFVIPGSTNSWQCVIEAAGADQMIPAHILNGKVVIVTSFYDGENLVSTSKLRVFYEE